MTFLSFDHPKEALGKTGDDLSHVEVPWFARSASLELLAGAVPPGVLHGDVVTRTRVLAARSLLQHDHDDAVRSPLGSRRRWLTRIGKVGRRTSRYDVQHGLPLARGERNQATDGDQQMTRIHGRWPVSHLLANSQSISSADDIQC